MEGDATPFAQLFGTVDFGDLRLNKRLEVIGERLAVHPNETFPNRFADPAELQAFYRFANNESVSHDILITAHGAGTLAFMKATPGVVLLIQDTTVLDYSGLDIAELGQIGNGHGRGLYCHNCLAVVAATREVLGLAGQILHRRRKAPKGEKRQTRKNDPQRESKLWKAMSQSIPAMPEDHAAGQLWVEVLDRGGDITEYLDHADQAGKKYVVRSQHNRWIERQIPGETEDASPTIEKVKLHDLARALPSVGTYTVAVQAKEGQPARTAVVSVSWQPVTILPPRQKRGDERGVPLQCWVVRVAEINAPTGVEALEWILLTNVPVESFPDALERIDWYRERWIVEEYHKAQKTGVEIENMQFTTLAALQVAIALLSVTAILLLRLRDQSRAADAKTRPATSCVPPSWVRMLSRWRHQEERMDWSVHDFFYALARLGGHQNRKHDHPPGWLVLWRGWMQLHAMLEGAATLGVT